MLPASLKVCLACGCTCEIYYIHKPDMSQQAAISVDAVARVLEWQKGEHHMLLSHIYNAVWYVCR